MPPQERIMNNWITFKTTSGTTITSCIPSGYQWSLYSVNAADSGRTYTGKMYTNRVTQKRKLELEFKGITWQQASTLLSAVNNEYFKVVYPDMLTGQMRTMDVYRGDVETSCYCWWDDRKILAELSFSIIER